MTNADDNVVPMIQGLPPVDAVLDMCGVEDKGQRLMITGQYELAATAYTADMKSLDGATFQAVMTTAAMMEILSTKKTMMENYTGMEGSGSSIAGFLKYADDVHLSSANKHPRIG